MITFVITFIFVIAALALLTIFCELLTVCEVHLKLRKFFSAINPFKKKESNSYTGDELKEFHITGSGGFEIKGSDGLCSSAGTTISIDPKIIEQLNSMQKQINALSADLYTLEVAHSDYVTNMDTSCNKIISKLQGIEAAHSNRLFRLENLPKAEKKSTKRKVVKKKYDDHKVHTKAYKNATKAKK